jgi:hypothetical protein
MIYSAVTLHWRLADMMKILENPALIISTLALLFTVFSFWWMHWRTGKLKIGTPRSFAAVGSEKGMLLLEIPLVFFNTGPTPILIQNLRLVLCGDSLPPLTFVATVSKLGKDEGRALATQFPICGRESIVMICEFQRHPGGLLFKARKYPVELQAKLSDEAKWKVLSRFTINVTEKAIPAINRMFIPHDNLLE